MNFEGLLECFWFWSPDDLKSPMSVVLKDMLYLIRSSATWKYNNYNYNNNKEDLLFGLKELHGSTRTRIMVSAKVYPCMLSMKVWGKRNIYMEVCSRSQGQHMKRILWREDCEKVVLTQGLSVIRGYCITVIFSLDVTSHCHLNVTSGCCIDFQIA